MKETTILIVEDELVIAYYMQGLLRNEGYTAFRAKNAAEAIEKINKALPDLIIMDVYMKGSHLDGIELAEHIKREHNIPIIFSTSFTDQTTLSRMEPIKPEGIFTKPFIEEKMLRLIKDVLSKQP